MVSRERAVAREVSETPVDREMLLASVLLSNGRFREESLNAHAQRSPPGTDAKKTAPALSIRGCGSFRLVRKWLPWRGCVLVGVGALTLAGESLGEGASFPSHAGNDRPEVSHEWQQSLLQLRIVMRSSQKPSMIVWSCRVAPGFSATLPASAKVTALKSRHTVSSPQSCGGRS